MREILFRGKRVDNGEWSFGNLIIDDDLEQYCIVGHLYHSVEDEIERYEFCYEIDSETVGQYIGLTDKNGRNIFEGDRLHENKSNGVVIFKDGEFIIDWGLNEDSWSDTIFVHSVRSTIIGNIHDKEATK